MSTFTITHAMRSWDDLRDFGIEPLTGEACGLAMRLLCDVTERGKAIIESFFGSRVAIEPDSNWNNGSKDDPHVGSVMLPRSIAEDLFAFVLCHSTRDQAVARMEDGTVIAWTGDLPDWRRERVSRYFRRSTMPGNGTRNTHMATGRIA